MKTLVILLLLSLPSLAFGFSAGAHRIIAEVAWQRMDWNARTTAYTILKEHPRYSEDFEANMPANIRNGEGKLKARWLFQQAAVWPDTVRGLPKGEKSKYDRGPWHYVNFPAYVTATDADRIDISRVNRSEDWDGDYEAKRLNIIQAFKLNLAGYHDENRTEAQRAVHLCWVLHLGGDAHQPLHSTALFTPRLFPKGDRGGNSIRVGSRGNLHSTWDRLLPNAKTIGEVGSVAVKLAKQEAKHAKQATRKIEPADWIAESYELAKQFAYDRSVRAAIRAAEENGSEEVTVELSTEYRRTAGRVAQRRVVQAGSRLGQLLGTPDD